MDSSNPDPALTLFQHDLVSDRDKTRKQINILILYSQVNSDWRKLFENAKERHLVVKVNSASDARRVIHERCKK